MCLWIRSEGGLLDPRVRDHRPLMSNASMLTAVPVDAGFLVPFTLMVTVCRPGRGTETEGVQLVGFTVVQVQGEERTAVERDGGHALVDAPFGQPGETIAGKDHGYRSAQTPLPSSGRSRPTRRGCSPPSRRRCRGSSRRTALLALAVVEVVARAGGRGRTQGRGDHHIHQGSAVGRRRGHDLGAETTLNQVAVRAAEPHRACPGEGRPRDHHRGVRRECRRSCGSRS